IPTRYKRRASHQVRSFPTFFNTLVASNVPIPPTHINGIFSDDLVPAIDHRLLEAVRSGNLSNFTPTYIRIKPHADKTIPTGDSAQGPEVGGGSALSPADVTTGTGDATATPHAQKDMSDAASGDTDAGLRRGDGPTIPPAATEAGCSEQTDKMGRTE
ncbi:hypothetical protein DFH11DRAFT_1581949, partial [Phellopilus nigrolimitatus]